MPTSSAAPAGTFDFSSNTDPGASTLVKAGKVWPANTPLHRDDPPKKAKYNYGSDSDMDPSTPTPSPRKSGRSASLGGHHDRIKPSTIGGILSDQATTQQPHCNNGDEPHLPTSGQSPWLHTGIFTQSTPAPGATTPDTPAPDTLLGQLSKPSGRHAELAEGKSKEI
ncbi:hypothetical protein M422DRAFT_245203 [Sphaerobolus stellatus SS14]|nr:hypothetical protein M422DRAFT_245203 [Sphaerobolus stellatus SS14]